MINEMKRKIERGEKVLGTFSELGGSAAVECLGIGGLDFFVIDTEHGPYDVETARDLIIAADRHGITPFVRVKDPSRSSVLKMLDVGAQGLIVPCVQTVEEVEKLVEYAKFYPLGRRGFAPVRAGAWGHADFARDTEEYFRISNAETLLIPQCETLGCLEHIDEIAAMPGVDGIFIGPFDLSIALGKPAKLDDPELVAAIAHVREVCHRHGKLAMMFAGNAARVKELYAEGFDGVACGLDVFFLIDAVKALVAEVNA